MIRSANFFFLLSFSLLAFPALAQKSASQLGSGDYWRAKRFTKECETLKKFVLDKQFESECHLNFHHFNANVEHYYSNELKREWVEIAAFNLWHPGSNSSPYKDFELVARLMNQYDIIAATELLPSVGSDLEHNERIKKFLKDAPRMISRLEEKESASSETEERLERLRGDLIRAPSLYRVPGYIRLLNELRKFDPSWSLILSPSGESSDQGLIQEFSGFYYRGRSVRPKQNEHCLKFRKHYHGPSIACYPKLTKSWFGKSIREVFSRRPFLGSFESGDFDFTLLTSHIVFRAPFDEERMRRVLMPTFGVESYEEMGRGANKSNYARLAEMKVITEMMQKIREESQEKDIIFLGDTNLKSDNEQWGKVLNSFVGGELFIDEPTTVSVPLTLSDGTATHGSANDYDHFILDIRETNECVKSNGSVSAKVVNFMAGHFRDLIDRKYLYRFPDSVQINPQNEEKRVQLIKNYRKKLMERLTIKRNRIVLDDTDLEESVFEFDKRVLLSQIKEGSYYKVYKEIISDHLPIYFSCRR